jgi:putative DNA primase/helicase
MMRRWLISAVAAAFNPTGVSAHGVLVLQGDQYLGKTKWFKSLVPADLGVIADGLMLRTDDKDSVKAVVSHWLVELGELDATFRKSDIAALKAFITKDRDVLRRPYAKLESEFARRTVFFASVNPRQFLHDPTGNRRYWTISAIDINHDHGLDMQQVWAEVYEDHYRKGESWFLAPEEMAALNDHNKDHEVLDPIRERLLTRLDWQSPSATNEWRWMTATDIMLDVGFDRPTRADVTHCGQLVQEMNGGRRKKSNGKSLSYVPPKISSGM